MLRSSAVASLRTPVRLVFFLTILRDLVYHPNRVVVLLALSYLFVENAILISTGASAFFTGCQFNSNSVVASGVLRFPSLQLRFLSAFVFLSLSLFHSLF